MKTKSASKLFFYLLIILSFIEVYYFYPLLPEKTAAHFNIYGQPDAWQSKSTVILINIILVISVALLFRITIVFITKIPEGFINLPNKFYWFSENRKMETYQKISDFLYWFTDVTLLFFLFLFYLIYESNINSYTSISPGIWVILIIYLAVLAIFTLKFYKYFNNVPGK